MRSEKITENCMLVKTHTEQNREINRNRNVTLLKKDSIDNNKI